jgi:hypothetical protein
MPLPEAALRSGFAAISDYSDAATGRGSGPTPTPQSTRTGCVGISTCRSGYPAIPTYQDQDLVNE